MTIPPQLDKHRALGVLHPQPNTPTERRRAALHVASKARDAADCARLLDMLGLTAADTR